MHSWDFSQNENEEQEESWQAGDQNGSTMGRGATFGRQLLEEKEQLRPSQDMKE